MIIKNDKIDIVVTYLNERDEQWQKDFNYWKEKEIKEGRTVATNRQAFGEERTREWDIFKYWFRAVEKNCPWVNKVFVIVQNERHIPNWLYLDNPKLRVVFHDEFIPHSLLPTFNAMTIGMYVSNIPDLSDNYIMCDDDFYFLRYIDEDRFFKDNKPVHIDNHTTFSLYGDEYLNKTDGVFYHILNNNLRFETNFMGDKWVKYGYSHLPAARNKEFEKDILTDYRREIYRANCESKFRHPLNLCNYMFDDLLKICGIAYIGDPYYNCGYCALNSKIDFNGYETLDMVCFNDTEQLDDYETTKEHLIAFLESLFPNKSSFEIEV